MLNVHRAFGPHKETKIIVTPAQAGVQCPSDQKRWIPAFAGRTATSVAHAPPPDLFSAEEGSHFHDPVLL